MKKQIIFFFCLLAISAKAQVNFSISCRKCSESFNTHIMVYRQGLLIGDSYINSQRSASINGVNKGDTYKSDIGHIGSIYSPTEKVTLSCGQVTFSINDSNGKPLSSVYVEIYRDGDKITSKSTNSEGKVTFHLAPHTQYAYKSTYGCGKIGNLEANQSYEISLTGNILEVVPKYGNIPVEGTYKLFQYGMSDNEVGSSNVSSYSGGLLSFNVNKNTNYWIRTQYGTFSNQISLENNKTRFYLEHYRVRFISNHSSENILYPIRISGVYNSKTTDGKGYADFYLIPGEYTYEHMGKKGKFSVINKDIEIDLSTKITTLSFVNGETGKACPNLNYSLCSDIDNTTLDNTYTSDNSGKSNVNIADGNYEVLINGLRGNTSYMIKSGETSTIPVYKITFSSISKTNDRLLSTYISDSWNNYLSLQGAESVYLPKGNYELNINGIKQSFFVDHNLTLDASHYKMTVQLRRSDNSPVSHRMLYLYDQYDNFTATGQTNINGIVYYSAPNGKYCIKDNTLTVLDSIIISPNDTHSDIILPTEIEATIKVNNKPYSGSVYFLDEYTNHTKSALCKGGKILLEMEENKKYRISVAGLQYIEMIAKDGMCLNFVDIEIKADGHGLTFPMEYTGGVYKNYCISGTNFIFAAIPMDGCTCDYWEINGTKFENDMVEYKIGETPITAVAHFCNKTSAIKNMKYQADQPICISIKEGMIEFGEFIAGEVSIYSSSGILVRNLAICSDRVNINMLTEGDYILVIKHDGQNFSAKFRI